MTATRVFFVGGLVCLGQVFGAVFRPDVTAELAAAVIALGAAAVLYVIDRRPS